MLEAARARLADLIRPAAPSAVRRFDAAAGGRRWSGTPHFGAIGPETLAAGPSLRSRARHAVANQSLAANAVSLYATGLVGAGVTAASGHPDPEMRRALDDGFAAWGARVGWPALQEAAVRALVTDGEALLRLGLDDDGAPTVQHLAAEQLDEAMTVNLADGRFIVGGVEFGADETPVAYHVRPMRPTAVWSDYAPAVRVPAEDVLHVFRPMGAGAVRGVSWFAPVLLALSEYDQFADAALYSAKIQAMLCGFLLDMNGAGAPFDDDLTDISLEPGTIRRLPAGFDVKFTSPQQMQQASDFADKIIRSIAAGLHIPEFLLGGDMRSVNYSSARTALVQFRQHLEQIQYNLLVPKLLAPVWRRWVTMAVLSGEIDAPGFDAEPKPYFAFEAYFPAAPWVDPSKDAQATREMIAAGLMSRRQAVASLGYSVERLDAEIAADREREAALGLRFGAPAAAAEPQPEESEDA